MFPFLGILHILFFFLSDSSSRLTWKGRFKKYIILLNPCFNVMEAFLEVSSLPWGRSLHSLWYRINPCFSGVPNLFHHLKDFALVICKLCLYSCTIVSELRGMNFQVFSNIRVGSERWEKYLCSAYMAIWIGSTHTYVCILSRFVFSLVKNQILG